MKCMNQVILKWFEKGRVKIDPSGCWLWQGSKNNHGYGRVMINRKIFQTHRLVAGVYDPKILVCHKCDTPACCNPDHLFTGTHADNTRDMMSKGRMKFPPAIIGKFGKCLIPECQRYRAGKVDYFCEKCSDSGASREFRKLNPVIRPPGKHGQCEVTGCKRANHLRMKVCKACYLIRKNDL